MEIVMLALAIAWFGWRAHRRQLRDAEAETNVLPTELWDPSPGRMPTQARRSEPVIPDKPTEHEPWSEVGVTGFDS